MADIKTKNSTYPDMYGLATLLTPWQLFKFLQIKKYIPENGIFEEYQDKLSDFVTDVSEYRKEI